MKKDPLFKSNLFILALEHTNGEFAATVQNEFLKFLERQSYTLSEIETYKFSFSLENLISFQHDSAPEPETEPEPTYDSASEPETEPEPTYDSAPEPETEPEPTYDSASEPETEPEPTYDQHDSTPQATTPPTNTRENTNLTVYNPLQTDTTYADDDDDEHNFLLQKPKKKRNSYFNRPSKFVYRASRRIQKPFRNMYSSLSKTTTPPTNTDENTNLILYNPLHTDTTYHDDEYLASKDILQKLKKKRNLNLRSNFVKHVDRHIQKPFRDAYSRPSKMVYSKLNKLLTNPRNQQFFNDVKTKIGKAAKH